MIAELNENEQAILASLNIQSNQGVLNAHLYNTMTLVLSAAPSITNDIKEMMLLGQAALLHDIGWTKLPGYMIQKGRPFTPQEKKLEKQHVDLSLAKLKVFPDIPERVLSLVASHHEMPNGKGYPHGLRDDRLDKGSRLLSIAIRYDEITHALFDNLGMLPAKAMKQLFKEALAGSFDQKLVSAFIHLLGVYPIGSVVKLSDNSKGVIVHHQPDSPLKPQIMQYYDSKGNVLPTPILLDTKLIDGLEIAGFIDSTNPKEDPAGILRVDSET
jgi:HD-GYP domain-containing protein (c-di-GMP phosphodiesterase class II)